MKLITFIIILSFTILGCSQEEHQSPPELVPERQEEFEFERDELELQREKDQRGRTSKTYHQEIEEEVVD